MNVRRTVTAKMAPPRQHMVCSVCFRVQAIPEEAGRNIRFCLNEGPPAKCGACCTCCQCTTRRMQFLATQQLGSQVGNPTQEAAYLWWPSPFFGSGSGQEDLLGSQVDNPLHETGYGLATPMLGSSSRQDEVEAAEAAAPAAPTEREKQFISMARNKISALRWSHCMRRRMLYAYFVAWYNIESC